MKIHVRAINPAFTSFLRRTALLASAALLACRPSGVIAADTAMDAKVSEALATMEQKMRELGSIRDISMREYVATVLSENGWDLLSDYRYHAAVKTLVIPDETADAIYAKYRDRLLNDTDGFEHSGFAALESMVRIANNCKTDGLWRRMETDLWNFIPYAGQLVGWRNIGYEMSGGGERIVMDGLVGRFGTPKVKELHAKIMTSGNVRMMRILIFATCNLPPEPELVAFGLSTLDELPESLVDLRMNTAAEMYARMSEGQRADVETRIADPRKLQRLKAEALKLPNRAK